MKLAQQYPRSAGALIQTYNDLRFGTFADCMMISTIFSN